MFNQDLYPTPEYAAQVPPLAWVFTEPEFRNAFDAANMAAARAKVRYEVLGVSSVLFAVLGLGGEAFSLLAEALEAPLPDVANIAIRGAAVVSVLLIVVARVMGYKQRWCMHVLEREELRQWRFRLLRDGSFVDACSESEADGRAIYEQLWRLVQQRSTDLPGWLQEVIGGDSEPFRPGQFQPPSVPEANIALLDLLRELRIAHQLRYVRRRVSADSSEWWRTSLYERYEWTSSLARVAFGLAVVLIVIVFAVTIFDGESSSLGWMSAIALTLAIISAGIRTLRSGLSLPSEFDSYNTYLDRVRDIQRRFDEASTSVDERWRLLDQLEHAASEELQRFLAIKMQSSFIA